MPMILVREFMTPRVGRWWSVDPLAGKAPAWTPYRFGFDNPITFTDPNGEFEIAENSDTYAQQGKFSKFEEYVLNAREVWDGHTHRFREAFRHYSGMTDEQIDEMLTPGNGPIVGVADLSAYSANGITSGEEVSVIKDGKVVMVISRNAIMDECGCNILIDMSIAREYEYAKGKENEELAELLLESTLFHEAVHYGNNLNEMEVSENEMGKAFERKVYGEDINREISQRKNALRRHKKRKKRYEDEKKRDKEQREKIIIPERFEL